MSETPSEKLYETAKENLGKDLSPTQNELGCAETVSTLLNLAFNDKINFVGTYNLWQWLKTNEKFVEVPQYEKGAIIICPTGTQSDKSPIRYGHCGVCGINYIMSNNSFTSKLDTSFNYQSWKQFYETKGGFKSYFYRRIIS